MFTEYTLNIFNSTLIIFNDIINDKFKKEHSSSKNVKVQRNIQMCTFWSKHLNQHSLNKICNNRELHNYHKNVSISVSWYQN